MIAPDMATMLGFVFTDAAVAQPLLQSIVSAANAVSFNAITVDGDTSTSDTLLVAATGAAGNELVTDDQSADGRALRQAIDTVLVDLAKQIVRDGEGASKFVTVAVDGAASGRRGASRRLLDRQLAPGQDRLRRRRCHWGRIVMAVGKAGEEADRDRLEVSVGGVVIARDGMQVDGYDETPVVNAYAGAGDRHPRESEHRWRFGPGMDLRPHPRLHRYQRQLSQLTRRRLESRIFDFQAKLWPISILPSDGDSCRSTR